MCAFSQAFIVIQLSLLYDSEHEDVRCDSKNPHNLVYLMHVEYCFTQNGFVSISGMASTSCGRNEESRCKQVK